MFKRLLFIAGFLAICTSISANTTETTVDAENSTPMMRDSIVVDSVTGDVRKYKIPNHKIWKPFYALYNYLNNTTKNTHKSFDGSFVCGPAYNANTSFAIGGGYTALYSFDKADPTLQKSILSSFFQVSVTGLAVLGLEGHNFMKHDRQRWNYEMSVTHYPSAFWGVGYDNAVNNEPVDFKQLVVKFEGDYTFKMAKNLYMGPKIDLLYTNTFKNNNVEKMLQYTQGQPESLVTFGLGFDVTYDSRDFAMNAYKGHYFRFQQLYFMPGLNTYDFWSTDIKYSNYTQLWTKCVMAFQAHGQFNYGNEQLPWTRLASTGFGGMGRGYFFGQYRDNNVMEAQLEFRQRIKWRLGVVAWAGLINVFHDFNHVYWKKTLPNYGFGVRWEFKPRVNVRVDYGFTRDGGSVVFNFGEAF